MHHSIVPSEVGHDLLCLQEGRSSLAGTVGKEHSQQVGMGAEGWRKEDLGRV